MIRTSFFSPVTIALFVERLESALCHDVMMRPTRGRWFIGGVNSRQQTPGISSNVWSLPTKGMKTLTHALLIFPHQLFDEHPGLASSPDQVILVEDDLFFGDHVYPAAFHKQKLWLHRSSMKRYEQLLQGRGLSVEYVDHLATDPALGRMFEAVVGAGLTRVDVSDPHDGMLSKRLRRGCERRSIELRFLETPMFLNSAAENREYRAGRKRWFMADFYRHQRQRLEVMVEDGDPVGGRWSFDDENRKKVPRKMLAEIPILSIDAGDGFDEAAKAHVMERYGDNPGHLDELIYSTSHAGAERWLACFLDQRFGLFGDYEDAMVKGERWLWHGVLTPMLNIGLLTPRQVLDAAMHHATKHDVPINSLEGFVRQLIGWREFMRATYEDLGVEMRTSNHWGHVRPMPASFYDGTTGIDPVDDVIGRVLDTGYCHHIERLMVLGGFMFLCEIHPDAIYRWFMELFVDSYDWVMVPNVYAMSQHADGGSITTKPYFSGSSYVRKMSNHPPGDWTAIWDGLYWRWIWNHVEELGRNPRWAMMCAMAKKMDPAKRDEHIRIAEAFLARL